MNVVFKNGIYALRIPNEAATGSHKTWEYHFHNACFIIRMRKKGQHNWLKRKNVNGKHKTENRKYLMFHKKCSECINKRKKKNLLKGIPFKFSFNFILLSWAQLVAVDTLV